MLDEPVTIILSEKGWLRQRQGHGIDLAALSFKEGDKLFAAIECRSPDALILLASDGRAYTVTASQIPGGKGDGVPAASLIGLQPGTRIVSAPHRASAEDKVLLSNSGGYGFVTTIARHEFAPEGRQAADDAGGRRARAASGQDADRGPALRGLRVEQRQAAGVPAGAKSSRCRRGAA